MATIIDSLIFFQKRIRYSIRTIWNWLTFLPDTVVDPKVRLQSQLLTVIFIILAPIGLSIVLADFFLTKHQVWYENIGIIALTTTFIVGGFLFWLNRIGRYQLTTYSLCIWLYLVIYGASVGAISDGVDVALLSLTYLLAPIIVSSILLSLRGLIHMIVGSLIGIIIFPLLTGIRYSSLTTFYIVPMGVVFLGSAIIVVAVIYRDNLERLRLADFNRSEAQFQTLIETAPIGMALTDLNGYFIKVNEAFAQLVGYEIDELVRMRHHDLTEADNTESKPRVIRQLIDSQLRHFQMQHKYVHKNGQLLDVELFISMIYGDDGQPLVIRQVVDVTEKLATESFLIQQQQQTEALLNTVALLNSSLVGEDVLRQILRNLQAVLPLDAANIMLIKEKTAYVVHSIGYERFGLMDSNQRRNISIYEAYHLRTMLRFKQPIIFDNLPKNPFWKPVF